ncbi:MAG: SpoIIE family protein phosphatase [Bacteroidota bacterium]
MRRTDIKTESADLCAVCKLYERFPDAVLLIDAGGIEWFNHAAKSVFGPGKLATPFDTVLKDLHNKGINADTFRKNRFYRCESVLENNEGQAFHAEISMIQADEIAGDHCIMIIRDIEGQVQNRENLNHLTLELKRLRKEAHMQKDEIESQKEVIETQRDVAFLQRDEISLQQTEIKSSILYARRIQSALLPSLKAFETHFPESFMLFKPKDIVSGDFFWISSEQNRIVVAAGDCTGHGVPGALMSMLGISFLNEIVNINGIVRADQILNNLRKRIIQSLNQKGARGETQDGMDMSIISVSSDKKSMEYSGAFNSLFLFRNSALHEFRGDRMPLGFSREGENPFTVHQIELLPDDVIYLYTDGYYDQFGWRENKKMLLKNFKKLLLDIQGMPMDAQEKVLESHLAVWKGDLEQLDDILVIGLKI